MEHATISTRVEGHVGHLRLNRPSALNAIYPAMYDEIHAALDGWRADPDVRCLVLSGAGRAFCAGGDMQFDVGLLAGLGGDGALELSRVSQNAARAFFEYPKPVIAQVHGAAVGGGMDLALACDLVIAAAGTKFGQYWTRRGVVPDMGGGWFLAQVVGLHRAKDLVYTGRTILAEEAYEMGLLTRVVPESELDDVVEALAVHIAAMPTQALIQAKRLMNTTVSEPLDTYYGLANSMIPYLSSTEDHAEGVLAFKENREPRYTGR